MYFYRIEAHRFSCDNILRQYMPEREMFNNNNNNMAAHSPNIHTAFKSSLLTI